MKKDIVIKVEGLSKQYSIGKRDSYLTLRDKLMELPNKIFKREKKPTFWALKDVSFEVKRGEVLGVIGRNGAGKSTLLKILARITEPTTGKITMRGRVASMLEVGTGFNPELTGRENIYLNGSILGMSHKEIDTKFTEITDFAGIGKFLDTPVKHYSSGMYVRLAFAVAAHLDSDILLVDEVLAVGDAEFQKKCLGKMSDLANCGRTVIFVSHNVESVRKLCNKVIILELSTIKYSGPVNLGVDVYTKIEKTQSKQISFPKNANADIHINKIWLTNIDGDYSSSFQLSESPQIWVELEVNNSTDRAEVSLQITNSIGVNLIFSNLSYYNENKFYNFQKGIYHAQISVDSSLLLPDTYTISITTHYRGERQIEFIENAFAFEILESNSSMAPYGIAAKSLASIIKGTNWKINAIK